MTQITYVQYFTCLMTETVENLLVSGLYLQKYGSERHLIKKPGLIPGLILRSYYWWNGIYERFSLVMQPLDSRLNFV